MQSDPAGLVRAAQLWTYNPSNSSVTKAVTCCLMDSKHRAVSHGQAQPVFLA